MAAGVDERDYQGVRADWEALQQSVHDLSRSADAQLVKAWQTPFAVCLAEMNDLMVKRTWLSGARTLLHALGLEQREVKLTAGLAWLLRPEGYHRLGDRVLELLLEELELKPALGQSVSVRLEETDDDTRADLVLRMKGRIVLIEAKVWAHEQPDQLDRLAELWQGDDPTLVFLTRTAREFKTASLSRERWTPLLWRDVARIVREATAGQGDVAPGVYDYLETLEVFHP